MEVFKTSHWMMRIYKNNPPDLNKMDQQEYYLNTIMGRPHKTLVTEFCLLGQTLSTSQLAHMNYRVSLSSNIHSSLLSVDRTKPLLLNSNC